MLTLHAYFDESGTHESSQAIAIAGYLSSAEQWVLFDHEWSAALSEWNLKFFHMTDFANHANEYANWTEQERRFRYARLATIIKQHTLASVALGFLRKSYELIFDKDTKRFVGGPYAALMSMCFVDTAKRVNGLYPSAKIAYVLESGGKGHGEIESLFEMNKSEPENREQFKLLSLRFENKRDFTALQAADILAYEFYRQLPRHVGLDTRPMRAELRHLIPEDEHSLREWGWLNDEQLTQWAKISQAAWHYHGRRPLRQIADKRRKKQERATALRAPQEFT